jgi:hypothetical protein
VFLSSTFGDADREVVGQIESMLSSVDVKCVTGRRLGGRDLTPEVMELIESSDGCVALMTRRERLGEPGPERWATHPWVRDEINHARSRRVSSIALVEEGVSDDGAYRERERIPFCREAPLAAFLALLETIRLWRQEMGSTLTARLSPDDLGRRFRRDRGLRCRYRYVSADGQRSAWADVEPIPAPGGTLVYLKGVRSDTDQVEVEVLEGDRLIMYSLATPSGCRSHSKRARGLTNGPPNRPGLRVRRQ